MKQVTFFILLCGVSSVAEGATFYVSPSGNDSNPGTMELPWKTPRKASRGTQAGDTVYFRGGNYLVDDQTYFYPRGANSGTPSAPITYASFPNEHATFLYDVQTSHVGRWIVYISEAVHDLVLENLTFRQSEASRAFSISRCLNQNSPCDQSQWVGGISLRGRRITVRDCQILNTSGSGIGGGTDSFIENNTISGILSVNYISPLATITLPHRLTC